jgi:hypothetical protein
MVKPMKSVSAASGGTTSSKSQDQRRESQARLRSARGVRDLRDGADVEPGRWARCEDVDALEPHRAEQSPPLPARPDELRTGVVRRADAASERESGGRERSASRQASNGNQRTPPPRALEDAGQQGDWRCLEWGGPAKPAKQRRLKRNSKVTIVQLAQSGELVRQNGPDAWLPEAGDFLKRMSRLVAQGLGFDSCRSLCLRGSSAVLSVAEAGEKVMAVSGPIGSMTNVLRRAGLE